MSTLFTGTSCPRGAYSYDTTSKPCRESSMLRARLPLMPIEFVDRWLRRRIQPLEWKKQSHEAYKCLRRPRGTYSRPWRQAQPAR